MNQSEWKELIKDLDELAGKIRSGADYDENLRQLGSRAHALRTKGSRRSKRMAQACRN